MTISAEQWVVLEKELQSLYGCAKLRLDGHELFIRWMNISKAGKTYALVVAIDGFTKIGAGYPSHGAYDPFVTQVWRKRSKVITLFKKTKSDRMSKREMAELNLLKKEYPDKTIEWYDPFFMNAKSLIRQYRKIEGLEFIEMEIDL
jgi:hypothetical protein